jgi:hypothetical protein
VFRLIIARHYSYPLKEVVRDEDTVYANWMQFVNALEITKHKYPERDLGHLVEILRDTRRAPEISHTPELTSTWTVKELSFTTCQEADMA